MACCRIAVRALDSNTKVWPYIWLRQKPGVLPPTSLLLRGAGSDVAPGWRLGCLPLPQSALRLLDEGLGLLLHVWSNAENFRHRVNGLLPLSKIELSRPELEQRPDVPRLRFQLPPTERGGLLVVPLLLRPPYCFSQSRVGGARIRQVVLPEGEAPVRRYQDRARRDNEQTVLTYNGGLK